MNGPANALRALLLVVGLILGVGNAHAHKPSDSYLTLVIEGKRIQGQFRCHASTVAADNATTSTRAPA